MTKAEFTAFIRARLVGGDIVDDTAGRYHENVIAALIGMALNHLSFQTGKPGDQPIYYMETAFAGVAVAERTDECWEVTPPKRPLGGQLGFLAIRPNRKGKDFLQRENSGINQIRNDLVINKSWPTYYLEGTKAIFEDKPHVDSVFVVIAPDFLDLDWDQEVAVGGNDMLIFQTVQTLIESGSQAVEDVINQQTSPDPQLKA